MKRREILKFILLMKFWVATFFRQCLEVFLTFKRNLFIQNMWIMMNSVEDIFYSSERNFLFRMKEFWCIVLNFSWQEKKNLVWKEFDVLYRKKILLFWRKIYFSGVFWFLSSLNYKALFLHLEALSSWKQPLQHQRI